MELFAFIGDEELPERPQRVGIKQGLCAAGMIPFVVMDYDQHKLKREDIVRQLQTQANTYGKTIRLARFAYVDDILVISPQPNVPTAHILHAGFPLCQFSLQAPVHWPPGHIWIGLSERAKGPPDGYSMCKDCASLAAEMHERDARS